MDRTVRFGWATFPEALLFSPDPRRYIGSKAIKGSRVQRPGSRKMDPWLSRFGGQWNVTHDPAHERCGFPWGSLIWRLVAWGKRAFDPEIGKLK